MRKLRNWTAKRAGGRITIDGVDGDTGAPVKVVGVENIKPGEDRPIATDKDGNEYGLIAAVDRTARPLTIAQLLERLEAFVAADEFRRDMLVTFGGDMFPVRGGIAATNKDTGLAVLNLAPITLDKVGGF